MREPPRRTLTAVQSPLSPGEQRDRAVLLVSGSAESPGPARANAAADRGRRALPRPPGRGAPGLTRTPRCWTTGWSRGSTRASAAARAASTWRISAARTAPGSTTCAIERKVRLRDGALIFFGNHVGRVPDGVADRARGDQGRAGRALRPGADRLARAGRRLRSAAAAGGLRGRAADRRRDRGGQGGLRARRARGERAQGALRRHQLRGDPARARRERALRLPRRARTRPRTRPRRG